MCAVVATTAYATSPCYEWQGSIGAAGGRYPDPVPACQTWVQAFYAAYPGAGTSWVYEGVAVGPDGFPEYLCKYHFTTAAGPTVSHGSIYLVTYVNSADCQCYVSAAPSAAPQCGPTCNGVGHPINPASGAVYDTVVDTPESANAIGFKRFYNSTDTGGDDFSSGWRHSFSRKIQPKYGGTDYRLYAQSQDNSSRYTDEATACTSGFAQIKARSSTWTNATASYTNGLCNLNVGNTRIGTLAILYTSPPTPDPSTSTLIGFDATRDDGQLISFTLRGGSILAPPSIGLRLQQISSGYTLTDENDNVETYDANGRLLSVTTRAGVVQTMGYDNSNRLSTVTDSFGHQLTLSYDSQNQLATVTRQ